MRYNKLLALASFFILCFTPCELFAALRFLSLKEAIQKKIVSVDAISNGGHRGKGLTLELTNPTPDPIQVTVDPGLIFTPIDTGYQNLVALGGEYVRLEPHNCGKIVLETFCGKSYAKSPASNLTYNYWKQGDSVFTNTLEYIRGHNLANTLGQSAVWTFTNNHCLSTVFNPVMKEQSMQLVDHIAKLRRMPIPKYFTYYEQSNIPGALAIMPGTGKQYMEIHWKKALGAGNLKFVNIYKENGQLYKEIRGSEVCNHVDHTVTVTFDIEKEKGRYYVQLEDNFGNVWDRKDIDVGNDWCHYAMN